MNRAQHLCMILFAMASISLAPEAGGRSPLDSMRMEAGLESSVQLIDWFSGDLCHVGVHNAGALYVPLSDGFISSGMVTYRSDPETGETIWPATYPQSSVSRYIFSGALWVGGIVGQDTLVSVASDGTVTYRELLPADPDRGAMYRVSGFADDEFVTTLYDTLADSNIYYQHNPLGIRLRQKSLSWADTLYDDFLILDYVITNIGEHFISDCWVGFYFDDDVYSGNSPYLGYLDDCSGSLDTLLYETDSTSRTLIAYGFDVDGDPETTTEWGDNSVTGLISIGLIDADFSVDGINFNWWLQNGSAAADYGPRHVGTPEDPLRLFANDNLGRPVSDEDKYYMLSHPEVDFDQVESAIWDSADGWIPPPESQRVDLADGSDTRYLYSFGAFDLAPGDSVAFTLVLAAADDFHTDPAGFENNFDPYDLSAYKDGLNFSGLLRHFRRADSVYRSGYYLPHPGAPAGLRITEYDDSHVDLAWMPNGRGDLSGYYIYLKDTVLNDIWNKVTPGMLTDTVLQIPLFEPTHTYFIAASLVDTSGRESHLSLPVKVLPGMPHPPESLSVCQEEGIPVLRWRPSVDTALQAYMIYRSIWRREYILYDSTVNLIYRDYAGESGVEYGYKVSAVNDFRFESDLSGPVHLLPMAMDRGILFCNLNRYENQSGVLYPKKYLDRLHQSVASVTTVDRVDADDSVASLKAMSHYPLIVFESSNLPSAFWILPDSVRYYLSHGGRAVFAAPCLGRTGVARLVNHYDPGDFYHDYLRLDSSVVPGVVFSGGGFVGDLVGCESVHPDYPPLTADAGKLTETEIPITGDIPVSGYLYPKDEVEPLYRYISSNPDTISHGQINGYRYITDSSGVIVLNFPLVAMQEQDNFAALRQALIDLGIDMSCGDITNDGRVALRDVIFLINHVYRDGPPPDDFWRADVTCDQVLNAEDILTLINYIFRDGWLGCCPQGGAELQ